MTTDITELAQSLKAAAEKATPGPWGVARDSKTLVSNQSHPIATVSDAMHRMLADGSTGKDAEFIALANPANIRALVEALEKAQQRISELESPTFTFEVTAEPFTCPRCGTTTTHPEGWHYCHKREGE